MNARNELTERLIEYHAERSGALSAGGRDELRRAVNTDPLPFLAGDDDKAFYQLTLALERYERQCRDAELIDDDDAYFSARTTRLQRLVNDCRQILEIDAGCLDAALIAVLAADKEPAVTLEALINLQEHAKSAKLNGTLRADGSTWAYVRARPYVRLQAALALTCLESSHYKLAVDACHGVLTADKADHLGTRNTCALALARLEDAEALEALDQRFERRDNAWSHLAHTILHYRLGRLTAARRALTGFTQLTAGGAYALLRATFVDTYLPDRPDIAPASYEGANMAVWEAEPIIASMPDFIAWVANQPDIVAMAQSFAEHNNLDW